jgi:hypothetical protein
MSSAAFRSSALVFVSLALTVGGLFGPQRPATAQAPDTAQAPAAASALRRVIDVHVKPESIKMWGDLHRDELVPALKKANVPWADVWASTAGDPYLRTIVTPVDSLNDMELAPVLARALGLDAAQSFLERNRQYVDGVNTYIMRTRPELGFGQVSPRRSVGLLSTITVYAGRTDEFEALLQESVRNTAKEINASGFVVLQVEYGGDPNQYRTVLTYDERSAVGAEQRDQGLLGHPDPVAWLQRHVPKNVDGLNPQSGSPVARIERTIITYQPELSFRPAAE